MAEKEQENKNILMRIIQDHSGNIPKILAALLSVMDKRTTFGLYKKQEAKKMISEVVDRHFDSRFKKILKELSCKVKSAIKSFKYLTHYCGCMYGQMSYGHR